MSVPCLAPLQVELTRLRWEAASSQDALSRWLTASEALHAAVHAALDAVLLRSRAEADATRLRRAFADQVIPAEVRVWQARIALGQATDMLLVSREFDRPLHLLLAAMEGHQPA